MKKNNITLKAIALLVTMVMMFALFTGCGNTASSGDSKASDSAKDSSTVSSSNTDANKNSNAQETSKQDNNKKSIKLGFSFGQSVHPFFIAMEKGARDAAKAAGVEIDVTSADYKLENQLSNCEDLLQKGVNALLLNPIDSKALANVANEAKQKGVGVFTVDINVVGAEATAFVASDNKEIGRMAAKYFIQKLNGKGKIAIIGWPTITSCGDREIGFKEEIAKQPGIQIVANQGTGMERSKALESAETILQAHPDIDAIFGVNESGAMGALGAVQARNLKNIFIVGVDATPDNLTSIKNGTQFEAAIAQDPYLMGKLAVENAIKHINGESIDKVIPVQIDLVTKDNVDKFITREAQYKK